MLGGRKQWLNTSSRKSGPEHTGSPRPILTAAETLGVDNEFNDEMETIFIVKVYKVNSTLPLTDSSRNTGVRKTMA